jgi:hypothetical protein
MVDDVASHSAVIRGIIDTRIRVGFSLRLARPSWRNASGLSLPLFLEWVDCSVPMIGTKYLSRTVWGLLGGGRQQQRLNVLKSLVEGGPSKHSWLWLLLVHCCESGIDYKGLKKCGLPVSQYGPVHQDQVQGWPIFFGEEEPAVALVDGSERMKCVFQYPK